ncbi:VapC toxin protein [Leucobacter sp. 7(1)]|uniref:type II toxin-antitoxin system VapC family toxin n=1 Tax=Leucobacter sp. 7(1) TaxID=1255613 RepID=UPI00097F0585|nr:type II toxin-antitoxin system VapC family toxin [Leucobacter sp. 7(1)]SJN08090.1 VapC toxin protein [Leucobacter sp. 7(1)]
MIVLDTNVISEVLRPNPDARVVGWLQTLGAEVTITAVTLAELCAGLRRLPEGQRKTDLEAAVYAAVEPFRSAQMVFPFDEACAEAYADILWERERAGLPIAIADAQIAAICRTHDAMCATRNVQDFHHTGIPVVNPWTD